MYSSGHGFVEQSKEHPRLRDSKVNSPDKSTRQMAEDFFQHDLPEHWTIVQTQNPLIDYINAVQKR